MSHFDVCVIGGGPAGYAAAIRAWDLKKKVCLIEGGPVGGAGLENGALSSKTLWELSRDYKKALHTDRGFRATDVQLDWQEVRRVVQEAVRQKREQMERQLREMARPRPGHGGSIEVFRGYAKFLSAREVEVQPQKGRWVARITADNFVIATGSTPRALPDVEIDGERIMTSDHLMQLEDFPESLVILGAGVVGCEFATIFANFGQTQVCLIDRAPRILAFEDEDIVRVCASNLQSRGVLFHQGAQLQSIQKVQDGVEYALAYGDGREELRRVERALVSIGRIPNVANLGLDAAGVELNERGKIKTVNTQTTVPHIYAVGDVAANIALVSVGEIEGRFAVEHMFGQGQDRALRYDNLSTIMFLAPEIASIGLNEQNAQTQKIPYRVARYHYSLANRALAMRATDGFIKLLVTNDEEMRILGMRALGVHASTAIEVIALMMQNGHSASLLAELPHPHPAVTESLQECVRMLLGTSIYKPTVFRKELRVACVHYDQKGRAIESPGVSYC